MIYKVDDRQFISRVKNMGKSFCAEIDCEKRKSFYGQQKLLFRYFSDQKRVFRHIFGHVTVS